MTRVKVYKCEHCSRECNIRIKMIKEDSSVDQKAVYPFFFDPVKSCVFFGTGGFSGSRFVLYMEYDE